MTEPCRPKNTKLFHHLKKWMEKAIMDYHMIGQGDRVLVGLSGGADSYALIDLLNSAMVLVPDFSFIAVNIDMGFDPEFKAYQAIEAYCRENGITAFLEKTDIGPLSHSDYNRKNPCFLCSRMRRKRIFQIAEREGCTKIAFAHHRDDIIETLLLNLFYGREISTMLPCQTIFAGQMYIIRPLAYIREDLVKKYSHERQFPVVKNDCPSSDSSKRSYIKTMIRNLEKDNPRLRENIWIAMSHVKPDYLMPADKK